MRLINVNLTDITDESGYISALGKEAAAKAINDAKVSVAEADRSGAIGEANARREQRISVSLADSQAITGENEAQAKIAESNATLAEKRAEALRRSTASEKIQSAKALQEAYVAEQEAEEARFAREKAMLEADVIVKAEISKRKLEMEAEAQAEQTRRLAKGEADALFSKMEAEARGVQEMLSKQANGLSQIVEASGGNANDAVKLMIADKLEELVKTQVEAIKNLKIDKITVWDSLGNGKDGKTATADFLSGMMKSIPPMNEMFDMAGMDLPEFLGKKREIAEIKKP